MTELLGQDGKKLTKRKSVSMAISGSDDGIDWFYIAPKDVPEWLKIDDVVEAMTNGDIVSEADDGPYYFGELTH